MNLFKSVKDRVEGSARQAREAMRRPAESETSEPIEVDESPQQDTPTEKHNSSLLEKVVGNVTAPAAEILVAQLHDLRRNLKQDIQKEREALMRQAAEERDKSFAEALPKIDKLAQSLWFCGIAIGGGLVILSLVLLFR